MSEIKTACRGTSRLIEAATMTHEEYLNLHTQGAKELRAAYESLQKENEAQAKRIAELEQNSRDFANLCKVNDEAIAVYIAKIKELEKALGADPKVIAAAPDLLEALCDMVSDQEYLSSKTIESAKKALEKALGVEAYWRCELLTEDKKQND